MDRIIEHLERLKNDLLNQQQQFLNLISENNRIISSIDEILNNQINIREPRTSNEQPLSNDEIIRYTYAVRYNELQHPKNLYCPLSSIEFSGDMMVCKLPCGHIFDGPSICRELSTINSRCPICQMNVRPIEQILNTNTNVNLNRNFNGRIRNENVNANVNAFTNTNTNRNAFTNTNANTNRNRNFNRTIRTLFDTNIYIPNINSQYLNFETLMPSPNETNLRDDFMSNLVNIFLRQTNSSSQLPTAEEINNSVEEIKYENIENPKNESCPIYYEDFSPDTIVCKMKCCGNLFSKEGINQWFSGHNTCPTCRHLITNRANSDASSLSTNIDSSNTLLNDYDTFYILRYRL